MREEEEAAIPRGDDSTDLRAVPSPSAILFSICCVVDAFTPSFFCTRQTAVRRLPVRASRA